LSENIYEQIFVKDVNGEDTDITMDERLIARKVFLTTVEGKAMLHWLLMRLGLYKPITNERDAGRHEFALSLLTVLGMTDQDKLEAVTDYYAALAADDNLNPRKIDFIRRNYGNRS